MIKKTLSFSNPAYLSYKNKQLVITLPGDSEKASQVLTRPVEDIGIVILDSPCITITSALLSKLIEAGVAVITCNDKHLPIALHLSLDGNSVQSEKFAAQISASVPLKKQLWQQTVSAKITNQATLLHQARNCEIGNMRKWASSVKSGDPDNLEARAAVYYWRNIFPEKYEFFRDRYGPYPNNLLNYGYAILRATVARALVSSGLLPTLGIHHHNRYNAYCLADDIMEPYRPYVDKLVVEYVNSDITEEAVELTPQIKRLFLEIPTLDVEIGGRTRPLMVAVSQTTASLAKCFTGEIRKIAYPIL
jgi:CRISPR-associated protein Cas1